jgi:hypothetical protein
MSRAEARSSSRATEGVPQLPGFAIGARPQRRFETAAAMLCERCTGVSWEIVTCELFAATSWAANL